MIGNTKCWECSITPVTRTGQVCPICRLRKSVEEQTRLQQIGPESSGGGGSSSWQGWADFVIRSVPAVVVCYLIFYRFWWCLIFGGDCN